MIRFRRFGLRLLALLLGLLAAVLATTYLVVSRANQRTAYDHARANLELTARVVSSTVAQRIEFLAGNAKVMTGDDALKQVRRTGNHRTLASLLQSFSSRVGAPVITFYDAEGTLLANSDSAMADTDAGPFRFLIREAADKDLPQHSGFSYLKGQLHVLIVVPYYAPFPNVFGWFGLAFPIDRAFAWKIRETTAVELTYVSLHPPGRPRVLATTLPDASLPPAVAAAAAADRDRLARTLRPPAEIVALPDDRYLTLIQFHPLLGEAPVALVLQRPLTPELAPARDLENYLVLTSLVALAAAAIFALVLARGVSEPVRLLAAHTEKIAAGDYATRLALDRADELGQLAVAMNDMSSGLAERDQVRDLLDKNVSPEVATQLLRDGAALGGEEREVTILFADLRGFTTLSEKLPASELVTLLNRYLDRMSGAIHAQGGVIDKFIGDAIMALFGAPVAQADAPDRALAAALAMERALAELNRELAAEGKSPLALGIGINTARVVAGNIGSSRRRNYSVLGDGVNVAARLQSLTRDPAYATNIVVSARTARASRAAYAFRDLGTVTVKGRAEPVEILTLDG